jgi:hypothetical protein
VLLKRKLYSLPVVGAFVGLEVPGVTGFAADMGEHCYVSNTWKFSENTTKIVFRPVAVVGLFVGLLYS